MDAVSSSEISVNFYQTTRRNPKDKILHGYCCENRNSNPVSLNRVHLLLHEKYIKYQYYPCKGNSAILNPGN
jgi:hypothetical protein